MLAPGALIVLKRRSAGGFADAPAADVACSDGATYWPSAFLTAAVKNAAGDYVEPSLQATSAAATAVTPPEDLRFSTINAPGASTYPISAVTFLLVWQDMCKAGVKPDQAKLVKDWLNYALGPGQQVAPKLQYAPLPAAIKQKAQAKVDGLQCNGQAIAAS